jgi:hypothetical protein
MPSPKPQPRAQTRHIASILGLATQADIAAGLDWYRRAEALADRLSAAYGCSTTQAAGVIAALSPNNKWRRNCVDAENLISAWAMGLDPAVVKVSTYNGNKRKACLVLAMEDPTINDLAYLLHGRQGRKVEAFFRCITGDHDAVCVDGHAYAIWRGKRISTLQTPSIGKLAYQRIAHAYRLVARRSLDICGEALTPAQVQAVTWVTYRRIHGIHGIHG